MKKRVFIVHGWGEKPTTLWYLWLKKELENNGFEVSVPEMPNTGEPEINAWVGKLKEVVKTPDEETYFIGHSIGCQTIMRYLETINSKIGGAIFVAGWFNLTPEVTEDEEDKDICAPWIENPINLDKIKENINKLTAIFSNNDPYVPISDSEIFKEKLGAKIIIQKDKGHFGRKPPTPEIPVVIEELMKIT